LYGSSNMKGIFTTLTLLFSFSCFSQVTNDSLQMLKLDEVTLTHLRYEQSKRNTAQQIESVSQKQIEFQSPQTLADLLGESGKLTVQQSQQAGGSPVIRGFEASRVLIAVDGVRMNNLIFRSGHLQNLITVDRYMVESADVLFGPSSSVYGSDALGGVVYLQTKEAKTLSQTGNRKFSGNFLSNYNTVNNGKSMHLDFNIAQGKWAALSSVSYNELDDLKMGKRRNGSNEFFGERPFYVSTINGKDYQVANPSKYVQRFSGYKQYDLSQKLVFKPNRLIRHSLNLQFSTTSDFARYDRLTDQSSSGALRSAEWNYGPQERFLSLYKFAKKRVFSHTDMNVNLSFQRVEESRINRNFGHEVRNSRIEKVAVLGLSIDFDTQLSKGSLGYGVDVYRDYLKSTAFGQNIVTGEQTVLDTRYPDGDNSTFKAEAYVLYRRRFLSSKFSYNLSARGGYANLKSTIATNFFNLPYTAIEQRNFTYSGAFGIVGQPARNLKLAFNLASAYRVPNVDDLSKIFESSPGTMIVPNENLKPEQTVTADLAITLFQGTGFTFENVLYITRLYDPIAIAPFVFNGQSTIEYQGQKSLVYANQNQGKGHLSGYTSRLKIQLVKALFFEGTFNFTQGSIYNNSQKQPMAHIAPIFGKVGFSYQSKRADLEFYMLYNGKKKAKDYSPGGEDNLQYAPADGTPSWQTYNLKMAFYAMRRLTVFAGVENILDTQYRTFSSGINAPGRNFYMGLKYVL
jgi:hemoglobin/transferrin/lactoferrin receptor protein